MKIQIRIRIDTAKVATGKKSPSILLIVHIKCSLIESPHQT